MFPSIGTTPVDELRRADLMAIIDAQKAGDKQRTASMLFSDLKQMFSFALDREYVTSDPMATAKKARIVGAATERDRALTTSELTALAAALPQAGLGERPSAGIWLLLATGARIGELMGGIWADSLPRAAPERRARLEALQAVADNAGAKFGIVDLESRTWHLPDTKNQRDHTIWLSDFTLSQLARLRVKRPKLPDSDDLSPWLFPGRDARRPLDVKTFGKQLADRQRPADRRLKGRSKNTGALILEGGRWTAHDLRRTAGTLMASIAISGDTIDECLNHMIESRVRRTYIRDRREAEQVNAFNALGVRLQQVVDGIEVPVHTPQTGRPHH